MTLTSFCRKVDAEIEPICVFSNNVCVIPTPGHYPDCLCYLIRDAIFTGDSYTPDFPLSYKWKQSNRQLAIESESKIKSMVKENGYTVYPGHSKI